MTNTEIAKKSSKPQVDVRTLIVQLTVRLVFALWLKDEAKINKDAIKNLEKVQGAFFNSGQYQIIFGTGTVNKIYDESSSSWITNIIKKMK